VPLEIRLFQKAAFEIYTILEAHNGILATIHRSSYNATRFCKMQENKRDHFLILFHNAAAACKLQPVNNTVHSQFSFVYRTKIVNLLLTFSQNSST